MPMPIRLSVGTPMRLLKTSLAVLVLVVVAAARAEAVTVRDIIELTRAGLGDEVLVALVEADNSRFDLDAEQIIALRTAGVSETVIVAMLRSGRQAPLPDPVPTPAAPAQESPAPSVVVIDHHQPAPATVVTVPVAVPVAVPVVPLDVQRQILRGRVSPLGDRGFGRFFNDGFIEHAPEPAAPTRHQYWGWGGKLRPGAWQPSSRR